MLDISYPCGRDVIEQVLPHRDPFVWVSRVVACEPGVSITAELDVDPSCRCSPVISPVIRCCLASSSWRRWRRRRRFCALVGRDEPGVLGFFAGIDKAKFRNQVQPGDMLTLKATITRNSSRMVVADVEALVGDKVAATATQKYVMAKAEQ